MIKKINFFKLIFILVIILFTNACYIRFNIPFDYSEYEYTEDDNLKYLEEENKRIEEEKQKKIASRNYIDIEFNPYFGLLNDEEKQIYYDLLENANNYNKEIIKLTYEINFERLHYVFLSLLYDNPELFWLKSYIYYKYEDSDIVSKVKLEYYDDVDNVNIMRQQIDSVVNEIVTEANKFSYVYQKEKYVHDILVKKITYDVSMIDDQRVYGALVLNKSVCSGYAKSFQLIMRKLNVPTFYVFGEVSSNGKSELHAWNLIKLDGELYNVDVTWDDYDYDYDIGYQYYNLNDYEFSYNHSRKELSTYLGSATATKYSYWY